MNLPLKPYNDFAPTSNWNTYAYYKNVFNDKMINDLTQMVESNYEFSKGRTGVRELGTDTDGYQTNNRDIAHLNPEPHTKWLYDMLFPMALEANEKHFHFDIDIVTDPIHYVIYPEPTGPQSNDGGHLDWHMDTGAHGVNKRKLAMTVQLSDPKDYDGGDFEICDPHPEPDLSTTTTFKFKKGTMIVFPSHVWHRVKPVTKGVRKTLVGWVVGNVWQ
mgnify:CR=1 FL=1